MLGSLLSQESARAMSPLLSKQIRLWKKHLRVDNNLGLFVYNPMKYKQPETKALIEIKLDVIALLLSYHQSYPWDSTLNGLIAYVISTLVNIASPSLPEHPKPDNVCNMLEDRSQ